MQDEIQMQSEIDALRDKIKELTQELTKLKQEYPICHCPCALPQASVGESGELITPPRFGCGDDLKKE